MVRVKNTKSAVEKMCNMSLAMRKITDFLAMAFCIDRTAKIANKSVKPPADTPIVEMKDSKRGTFYVMMWNKEMEPESKQ